MESMLLLGFVGILKESIKIFSKNGKIMASVALFTFLAQSTLYMANVFSIIPFISDLISQINLLQKITTPDTPEFTNILTHVRKDIKIFFGLELIFFILDSIAFLLSATATILAAAIIYSGKEDLSLKDLVLRTTRTLKRPFITWLWITLFGLVYIFVFSIILVGILLSIKNQFILAVAAILLGVSTILFYIYLSVTWLLAIVVSAVEEIRGFEAISKASEIAKGMKLQGYLLNLLFSISSMILVQGINMVPKNQSLAVHMIVALVVINCASLLRMYWFAAITVFYYRCKKTHGERVELGERLDGYSKIPTTTTAVVIAHNIP